MSMNDPILEVLREIKSELVDHGVEIRQLVRHAERTNTRLEEHTAILHEHTAILHEHTSILRNHSTILARHERRLESIDNHVAVLDHQTVATVATLELLHSGMQTMGRRFDLGQVGGQRLEARVEDCERRIDALEHDDDR